MSTLNIKFDEALKTNSTENYTTVSVRTPMEVATMIDTISLVTKEAVMNLFTSDISDHLAGYLLEDPRNMELLVNILKQEHEKEPNRDINNTIHESSIESLINGGVMSIESNPIDYSKI